ncbi:tRNA-intron lyase [Candidatus Woesearchaeota archaeon]|nr:tRNA-intron lyase [Candidatus Woesearchaeota archaeon]
MAKAKKKAESKKETKKKKNASEGEAIADEALPVRIKKEKIKCSLIEDRVVAEASPHATELYNQSRFGILLDDGKLQLNLIEGLYLVDKGRIVILDGRNKPISGETFVKKAKKLEPNFWVRYQVYKDMRNRGYIVKTALKFGADFRVYDRGIKPGEDHARWIVYPVHEASVLTWYEFAAKNRVAHSTKKRLMLGIVDDENDCTYYEVRWMRP